MENKRRHIILSSQFNYQYGDQTHFPYSIARLVAHVRAQKEISDCFEFERTFVIREELETYINNAPESSMLICSCYIWNWEITLKLAAAIKSRQKNCVVVLGGPQVPDRTESFFEKYPFVDILVHGEGEITFEEILKWKLGQMELEEIDGISTKDLRTAARQRVRDLNQITSPYISETIWDLVQKNGPIKWIASWETNRGCPYKCTFCDWGSNTFAKMARFPDDVLHKEIEWFSSNGIEYIDCCDSNFGIFPRDQELARLMKEQALKTGYPHVFRQSWAKNSSDRIIPVAKELKAGGLLSAVGLAVESLDKNTLTTIKRKNIKFEKFSELTEVFEKEDLPTYTEIIRGLPGETLLSFKAGLESLVSDSKIGAIYIYNCTVLPNAELNQPAYRSEHKIQTTRSPIFLAHSSTTRRGIEEYEHIVTGSSSFSVEELKEMYLYSWFVLTFHSLGILEQVSNFCHRNDGLEYMKFFDILKQYCEESSGLFSKEYSIVRDYISKGYQGQGWNHYDSTLGEIFWPIEEASWLRITRDRELLCEEIVNFINYLYRTQDACTDWGFVPDLARFQIFLLTTRDKLSNLYSETFRYNWAEYFSAQNTLKKQTVEHSKKPKLIEADPVLWNFKVIWYGRRKKTYKTLVSDLLSTETDNYEHVELRNQLKPPP